MQLVHVENYLCVLKSMLAPRPIRLLLFYVEEKAKGSSSSHQLLRGHTRQHNSYICLTAAGSHPCPARAGGTLHVPSRWTRPRRFGTKLLVNKTAPSLRHYGLVNHTHLCRRIRRTLSLWCLNPNRKPVPPTRIVLVWVLGGGICVSVSTCFGVTRGFTAPKNQV